MNQKIIENISSILYQTGKLPENLIRLILIFFLFLFYSAVSTSLQAAPAGLTMQVPALQSRHQHLLPSVDHEVQLAQDRERVRRGEPPHFAVVQKVDHSIKMTGQWNAIGGNKNIWRISYHSPKAESLNFGFTQYFMPPGGALNIYSPDGKHVLGPFTDANNQEHGQLWTPVLAGDRAIIEVVLPSNMLPYLRLKLESVNHGYRDFRDPILQSGSCNIDVVCPQGDAWRNEIRSEALYSLSGFLTCSGQLINNVSGDFSPYLLTANHCGINAGNAPSMVVYWNYETSSCGGTPDGTLDQFQTGATLVAGYSASDFTLVELNDAPLSEFNVHWAGWDRSGTDVTSAVAIHHPSADEKRISFEVDPLSVTSYLGNTVPGDGTHWRVFDWDLGTTEPGSSGSGLWDQNHRLVGQLHGGFAACGNDLSDWYGRLSVSWDGNGTPSSQLKAWLDPGDSGAMVWDGTDACTGANIDFSITPNPALVGEPVQFTSTVTGGVPPYTYVWDFDGDGIDDSIVENPVHVYTDKFIGNVGLAVTDATECPKSLNKAIVVTTDPNDEIFPVNGVMPPQATQTPGTDTFWHVSVDQAWEGSFSLKSDAITHLQVASMEATLNFSQGMLGFYFKVSSERNYDYLRFYIDGVLQGEVSGDVDWRQVRIPISAGRHTVRWSYEKDGSVSTGADAAWVDLVRAPIAR